MKIPLKTFFVAILLLGLSSLIGCGGGSGIVVEQGGERVRPRGTVRDAPGNPVANATLTAPGTDIAVQTDANGNFDIRLPVGVTELIATASGFSTGGATLEVRRGGNDLVVVLLTPGNTPPVPGNQPPQVGVLTVTPSQIAVTGTVNFSATVTDNDSANLTAIAVITAPDGSITGVPLVRVGNTLSGAFVVPPNANRTNPPQIYTVVVGASDGNNGSNQTAISNSVTFTVHPPLTPPGQPL